MHMDITNIKVQTSSHNNDFEKRKNVLIAIRNIFHGSSAHYHYFSSQLETTRGKHGILVTRADGYNCCGDV